jgi:hypothetical protein
VPTTKSSHFSWALSTVLPAFPVTLAGAPGREPQNRCERGSLTPAQAIRQAILTFIDAIERRKGRKTR